MKKIAFALAALTVPLFVTLGFAWQQGAPPQPPQPQATTADDDLAGAIKVDVDVVSLYCSVRNKQNGLVSTLEKGDFDLAEDAKPQTVKYFSRETDIPLTLGVLVDVSGSQRNLIETERRATSAFFSSVLKKKDVAFLVSFGATQDLLQDLTGSPRLLQEGLNNLKPNFGFSGINSGPVPTMNHNRGTVMYDSVYASSHDILSHEVGRKALILITDGQDEGSSETEKSAIEAAQKADSIIYGILYADRGGYRGLSVGYSGASVLKHMADETGGRLFEVGGKNSLQSIFDQIQQEMRTQYLIGYTPTNPTKDGAYRKIDLRAHDKDLKVQVRKGYYAMPPL